MRIYLFLLFVLFILCFACDRQINEGYHNEPNRCVSIGQQMSGKEKMSIKGHSIYPEIKGALLASRISSLEELKSIIHIKYFNESGSSDSTNYKNFKVRLKHCSNGKEVISELKSGISQDDIVAARDGNFFDRIDLLIKSPYAVSNRKTLSNIYTLARRKYDLFGWGDVAFYDFAEIATSKINTDIAFISPQDSSEKGYINTFNHITAQAIITSCFSERMADFIADAHELHNMPDLINGQFTREQLKSPTDNPIDNYVDMINNEWGQEIGKLLKKKYAINQLTHWTPELLANYLNDLQSYYSWAFEIGMEPFCPDEEKIIRFSSKMNKVLME